MDLTPAATASGKLKNQKSGSDSGKPLMTMHRKNAAPVDEPSSNDNHNNDKHRSHSAVDWIYQSMGTQNFRASSAKAGHVLSGSGKKSGKKQASRSGENANSTSKGAVDLQPFDGHLFIGCFKDNSPLESRLDYDDLVPKEEKQRMSSAVCFEFCRSKAHVEFFALYEGRKCYCSPYLTLSKGRQEQCEEPCQGQRNEMCGGITKGLHTVSAYEMHRDNVAS